MWLNNFAEYFDFSEKNFFRIGKLKNKGNVRNKNTVTENVCEKHAVSYELDNLKI